MSDHDMTYVQPPTMTQRHVDAIWQCYRLFCFPGFTDQQTLLEIWQHLTALLAQPVPSRETEKPEALTFPDLFLKANQHIIDRIVAMNDDEGEATKTRHPVESHSPEDWRREFTPPTVADCFECDQ